MHRLDFTDALPSIVDVTTSTFVASTLVEAKIDCIRDEKDVYLYYFVTRYPGRTIVFVNSIDALRRLTPIFQLLGVEVLGLHAQMQQRQRLKNLDRYGFARQSQIGLPSIFNLFFCNPFSQTFQYTRMFHPSKIGSSKTIRLCW